jgi:hypothetical protein
MGWFSDFVSDPIGTLGDTGQTVIDTVKEHPLETAALIGAGYYYPTATALEGGLAPVSDAVAVSTADMGAEAVSGIDLGGAGASPASWTNATTADMVGSATSGWTAGQVASTVTSGLNLATSAAKLSMLGKTMNASNATAGGLTGALAPTPIETANGLITTTPQGPVVAGTSVPGQTGGFMGMDNQTLFAIVVGIAAVWYFSKGK